MLADRPGNELAACALRLQRSCGLRIGELLDLELDCVHEVPSHGSWLKIPLGKLQTERMVPLDEDILQLIDRIIEVRSHGRPMPHPRYRRPAQFLFTHHGRRLSQNAVRAELTRAAQQAGLGHITPHQLCHTYATALERRGVASDATFRRWREEGSGKGCGVTRSLLSGLAGRRTRRYFRGSRPAVAPDDRMRHPDLLRWVTA
jgi:integrase